MDRRALGLLTAPFFRETRPTRLGELRPDTFSEGAIWTSQNRAFENNFLGEGSGCPKAVGSARELRSSGGRAQAGDITTVWALLKGYNKSSF